MRLSPVPWRTRYRIDIIAVVADTSGIQLKERRLAAGLTQRELARLSGIAQPNIAAYESARRTPRPETLRQIEAALTTPSLRRVRAHRGEILRAAERRNLSHVRVFGSVARDEASGGSDVDLLVHPGPEASVFDLAGFMAEVEELLGVHVDLVSDRAVGPVADRIRREAIAL